MQLQTKISWLRFFMAHGVCSTKPGLYCDVKDLCTNVRAVTEPTLSQYIVHSDALAHSVVIHHLWH